VQQNKLVKLYVIINLATSKSCFLIAHWSRHQKAKIALNNGSVIMPEMANVVICPDTGKSLKYQELITLLRYKIRLMRSTANEIVRLAQGSKDGIKGTNTIRFMHKSGVAA
jgi:hypothetical protein